MEGLKKNLDAVPGTRSIDSLQTTAVLGTSHQHVEHRSPELEALAVGITFA
jgi:hypothetical protein